ncbi:MAG TPA: polysaccharide biosynthesis/export family protein [Polyangiaceae bacterium]|nr:polysaccharide biosynthesis/export family protein [Polyangiaceae bacterium]
MPFGTTRGARRLTSLLLCFALFGPSACGPSAPARAPNLVPPTERNELGPGDIFIMEIVGEKDLPQEYQVASDGTVDLPYLHTVKVADLEAQEVARLIRNKLIEAKILSDPSVVVEVKEFSSRKVTILGQVAKPGSFTFLPGMTLIQAISQAGGLTAVANGDHVNLSRKTADGKQTVQISVGDIIDGKMPDIPLQAGDQIYVHERIF